MVGLVVAERDEKVQDSEDRVTHLVLGSGVIVTKSKELRSKNPATGIHYRRQ